MRVKPDSRSAQLTIVELYKRREANQLTGFLGLATGLDPAALAAGYLKLLDSAPRRHSNGKRYFVGHTGNPLTGAHTNRREEHLALALWNHAQAHGPLSLPDNRALDLLDYQLPLKAAQTDRGFGKVDLFGAIDGRYPCVIELKIHPEGTGNADTPLRAFLEALAYCAVVEANASEICSEAQALFGRGFERSRPHLMVMATSEYWRAYARHPRSGNWWPALGRLAGEIEQRLGIRSHFIALEDCDFRLGLDGQRPRLLGDSKLVDVAQLFDG